MNVLGLLNDVNTGTIVLPDFQRSFIWEPEDVRELLVSVLGDYFIGSMLVLDNLKDDSPFALRLIEGVEKVNTAPQMQSIVKILLDGQQRVTALFYALYEPDLPLKNRKNRYLFFLDVEIALKKLKKEEEKEWDDCVIAVSAKDKKRLSEVEKNNNIIPFKMLRDIGKLAQEFKDRPSFNEIIGLANAFMNREIYIVSLGRETDLERIVETFERINRTGEPLSTFELLTARLYKANIKLRDLLETVKGKYGCYEFVPPEFILKVIALLRAKAPKRKNVLELEPKNFQEDWDRACEALDAAYKRITDIKNGYGVLNFLKWMPYTTMLVPLASIIDLLKVKKLETKGNYDKIDRWYWTSVLFNRYDQASDSVSASDFKVLEDWISDNSKVPEFIRKTAPDTVDLDTDKQSSAIYRGIISLIVLNGALDFQTGQAPQFGREKIEDDHIFPKSVYKNNSILNRTLISTNAKKADKKPSEYFRQKVDEHGEEQLKRILKSHIIPEEALDYLLKDDLQTFIEARKSAIINTLKDKLPSF